MNEPALATMEGQSVGAVLRRFFLATRPKFFTASVLPVLLGTVFGAASADAFDAAAALLAVLAIVFVHGAVNVLNDVYDDLSGNDGINEGRIHPFTGGSRFIQNGILSRDAMRRLGLWLLGGGALLGGVLAGLKGWEVLAFGLVGTTLGVLYSAPPVWLTARGLGELAVGLGFGPVPVVGAAWLQTGTLDAGVLMLSLPPALWIANVILINEVPDAPADAAVGRRTLAVRLGREGVAMLYMALNFAAVFLVVWAASLGAVPIWTAAGTLVLLGLAVRGWVGIRTGEVGALGRGIRATLALHALGTLWLTAAAAAPLFGGG